MDQYSEPVPVVASGATSEQPDELTVKFMAFAQSMLQKQKEKWQQEQEENKVPENPSRRVTRSQIEKDHTEQEDQDMYCIMPPIESFMSVPPEVRAEAFYKSCTVGDILICRVDKHIAIGLICLVIATDGGFVRDMNLSGATVLIKKQTIPGMSAASHRAMDLFDPADGSVNLFPVGQLVCCVVTSVNLKKFQVFTSLRQDDVPMSKAKFKVGLVEEGNPDLLPVHFVKMKDNEANGNLNYRALLKSDKSYKNPASTEFLVDKLLKLPANETLSFFPHRMDRIYDESECFAALRAKQNKLWASIPLKEGIKALKEQRFNESEQWLTKAIKCDPDSVDAYVARGCLYANVDSYTLALNDFNQALKMDPKSKSARSYCCRALVSFAESVINDAKLQTGTDNETEAEALMIGIPEKAEKLIRRAIQIDVNNPVARAAYAKHLGTSPPPEEPEGQTETEGNTEPEPETPAEVAPTAERETDSVQQPEQDAESDPSVQQPEVEAVQTPAPVPEKQVASVQPITASSSESVPPAPAERPTTAPIPRHKRHNLPSPPDPESVESPEPDAWSGPEHEVEEGEIIDDIKTDGSFLVSSKTPMAGLVPIRNPASCSSFASRSASRSPPPPVRKSGSRSRSPIRGSPDRKRSRLSSRSPIRSPIRSPRRSRRSPIRSRSRSPVRRLSHRSNDRSPIRSPIRSPVRSPVRSPIRRSPIRAIAPNPPQTPPLPSSSRRPPLPVPSIPGLSIGPRFIDPDSRYRNRSTRIEMSPPRAYKDIPGPQGENRRMFDRPDRYERDRDRNRRYSRDRDRYERDRDDGGYRRRSTYIRPLSPRSQAAFDLQQLEDIRKINEL